MNMGKNRGRRKVATTKKSSKKRLSSSTIVPSSGNKNDQTVPAARYPSSSDMFSSVFGATDSDVNGQNTSTSIDGAARSPSSSDMFSSIFRAVDSNVNDRNTSTSTSTSTRDGVLELFSSSQAHKLQRVSSERIVKNQNDLKNVGGVRGIYDRVGAAPNNQELDHSDRQKIMDRRRKRNDDSIQIIKSITVTLPTFTDNEEEVTEEEEEEIQNGIMRLFTNQADAVMRDKGVLILTSSDGDGDEHSSVRIFHKSLLDSLSAKAKQIEDDICIRLRKEGRIWRAKDQEETTAQKNDQLEMKSAFRYHEVASRCLGRLDIRYGMDQEPFSTGSVVDNPYVMPIVTSLLGKNAKLIYAGLILSFPNSRDQPFHQDGAALFEEDDGFSSDMHLPPYALNVFIPLDDISEELGPTEFYVGSHYGNNAKKIMDQPSTRSEQSAIGPLLKSGDVLLYDYRICHRGTSNLSIDKTRPMLYLMYARPWFCEHLNFGQNRLFP